MKLALFSFAFFCLYGYSTAAIAAVNLQLNTACTVDIYVSTNCAVVEYNKAAASALFKNSQWVRTSMTQLHGNINKFITQVTTINNAYQTGTQYVASPVIRDALTFIIQLIRQAQSASNTAKVSNAATISAEVNALVTLFQSVRAELVQYTEYNFILSLRLLSTVFSDDGCQKLTDGIVRSAKVIQTAMTAIATRVVEDKTFEPLAFALDFQMAVQAGNNAAMNVALAAQSTYYDTWASVGTQATYIQLNTQSIIFDGYTASIIIEFNGFASYAQILINNAVNLVIRLIVSSTTVNDVYMPLATELLIELTDAYSQINGEFLIAIKDCKDEIDSSTTGANGSNSSGKSSCADGSNNPETPYSMKGEVKKCQKRGAGMISSIQAQYSKSPSAATCGAFSVNAILTQVAVAQTQVNTCTLQSVVSFRSILEQVKALIKAEVDKNVEAMKTCACDAETAKAAGGSSGEVAATCTQEKVDVKFSKLRTDAIALVAQLQSGGKYRTETQNCRLKVRSDLKGRLTSIKASFKTCSGVPDF